MRNIKTLIPVILTILILGACSDGTVGTGGGAGDTDVDGQQVAVALISPLVGLYDLPDNFEGGLSEAFLDIQSPDDTGTATALLFRFNTFGNCIESRPTQGDVTQDPFSDRIFLDGIFALDGSTLSLSGSTLIITLFEDVNDVDGDGDFAEQITLSAPRIAIMVSDLGETCV